MQLCNYESNSVNTYNNSLTTISVVGYTELTSITLHKSTVSVDSGISSSNLAEGHNLVNIKSY